MTRVALAGEALIDFTSSGDLRFDGHVGGSPFNAAVAVARLGEPTLFVGQLSSDLFGIRLRSHLVANAVDTSFVLEDPAPTTVAFVERDGATNRYQFLAQGSADSRYAPDPLPVLPADTAFLHFGSVSLLAEPAATSFTRLVKTHRDRATVVLDPNIRPSLIGDADAYRRRCDEWIRLCHVLKLSEDDLDYLVPDGNREAAIQRWLDAGPTVVLVTAGAGGAAVHLAGTPALEAPAFHVVAVDTIGAGDVFTAAVTVGLVARGVVAPSALHDVSPRAWREVLRFASAAAAVNCLRAGADPPTRAEVEAFLAAA